MVYVLSYGGKEHEKDSHVEILAGKGFEWIAAENGSVPEKAVQVDFTLSLCKTFALLLFQAFTLFFFKLSYFNFVKLSHVYFVKVSHFHFSKFHTFI